MPRYVAFLRAINLSGRTVRMERLRRTFERLGFYRVETFIASGNVIFESADLDASALENWLEEALRRELGFKVATFLRTDSEVASVAQYEPFAAAPWSDPALYVGMMRHAPEPAARDRCLGLQTDGDRLHIHERELYWLAAYGMGRSKLSSTAIEKALAMPLTMRNMTTMRRLAARYPPTG